MRVLAFLAKDLAAVLSHLTHCGAMTVSGVNMSPCAWASQEVRLRVGVRELSGW